MLASFFSSSLAFSSLRSSGIVFTSHLNVIALGAIIR
jgi:hypothetical protein